MTEPEEDFAALFEASFQAKRFERGQTIEGTIVAIGPEVALVNVGGKGEAEIEVAELKDPDGVLEVAVGDRIHATVVSTSGGLKLSRKLLRGAADAKQLEDAWRSGLPVEGKIETVGKAGYDVRIGRARAFCPFSQIDIHRTADPAQHVGRVYPFRIIEYKEGGRNIIVSRRALLEDEQRARADEIRKTIVPGAILTGRVASVRDFGAFVDLGAGVQGLLHVSEMRWSRVQDASAVVTPGEEITVQVLRVDEATQKIALGLKQLTVDPWAAAAEKYVVGQTYIGRVTRIADFGAFVELEPGLTGLVPSGETGVARESNLANALPVGTDLEVIVLDVDAPARRMRLSRKAIFDAREAEEVREYAERAQEAPSETFGSLADKLRGAIKPPQN